MRFLILMLLIICQPVTADEQDPWESWNRSVFAFNETLDKYILRPVAVAYRNVTPQPVDDAISNVFGNLAEPITIVSDLGQGKVLNALSDTGRFVINSTVGLLGLFDVASHLGLGKHNEDIGQTLAVWGVKSGPYLMLPFLGPSTLRDAAGLTVESFTLSEIDPQYQALTDSRLYYGTEYIQYLDLRADIIPVEGIISGDRYSFIRSLFLQRRQYDILDGAVVDDFSEEFEDEIDE